MRRLCHIVLVVLVSGYAASLVACSSGTKAYIPVDNTLRTWQPPEGDAYTPDPAPVPSAAAEKASSGKVDKPPAAAPAKEKKADKRP